MNEQAELINKIVKAAKITSRLKLVTNLLEISEYDLNTKRYVISLSEQQLDSLIDDRD